jgi:hypothetical protein
MPPILADAIELAVGGVCLAVSAAAWRRGLKPVALLFGLGGVVAVGHAAWSLLT